MFASLLAAAALAGAASETAPGEATEVAPAVVETKAEEKKKHIVCVNERNTGSHRVQRVCYDKDAREETRENMAAQGARQGSNVGTGLGATR